MIRPVDVNKLKCDQVRDTLERLIEELNGLDEMDYFGREGWHKMLLGEDE